MDWFDTSLYPDVEMPPRPEAVDERVDYVARVCGAWDFGILPGLETVRELASPAWREAVERCSMFTSCSYHLLRRMHGLPGAPFLGSIPAYVMQDPSLRFV